MEIKVVTPPSIQPRPCTDSNCRGQHAPAERVALAMSLCDARGAQLTTLRRQVLELLWESGRPTGAYELIEALKLRNSRPVGPPTVYRALEFLMSQRFVLKIESRNAYVPCAHPERRHDCLFLHLQELRGVGGIGGPAGRAVARRGCRRPGVPRDATRGRGGGHLRELHRGWSLPEPARGAPWKAGIFAGHGGDEPSFSAYGTLSGRNRREMIAGSRVEVAPYKRDPADFVLWKPSTPDLPGWESPWGRGRPGWHIECSAMIERHLGVSIDIHGGGQDLIFPHHENEIAQGTCAHDGKTYCRYWVHNGFVTVGGRKMSKSLGNCQP